MRTIKGLQKAQKALCEGRGLNLDNVPPEVLEKTSKALGKPITPVGAVELILERVREDGDDALRDLTQKLDGTELTDFEVPLESVTDAYRSVPDELVRALELAARRIRKFHQASLPSSWMDFAEGYGEMVSPVERVGVYIPGGMARLFSTVLMTAIPAKVAGVTEVTVATPVGPDGSPDPTTLVACDISGVNRIFQIGGAQAIAAMAYGTETVPKVDVVCGPGNVFVTLAKKLLFGEVGMDGLFGPTETVVIADETANPTLCAADLLAQAEHDVLATPVFITTSQDMADAVTKEIDVRVERLERGAIARQALDRQGAVVVVENLDEALELANQFAPEHLSLMVDDPWRYTGRVQNAGALFLGNYSHEVLGDYVAGPSHVMPTGGTARYSSGVNVRSFLKFVPVIGLDEITSSVLSRVASVIGRGEGLTGHAEAAEVREELLSS